MSRDGVRWTAWQGLRLAVPMDDAVLGEVLDGGQSFRWRQQDNNWVGIFGRQVVRLRRSPSALEWQQPAALPDAGPALANYLDAEGLQAQAAASLPWRSDKFLAAAMAPFPGLRILKQESNEALLAFLCSSNKQIIQIRRMVAALAEKLGPEISPGFHALPDWTTLARADAATLKACGLGYRANFIQSTAKILARRPTWVAEFSKLETPLLLAQLATLPGVGPKVAACVALFGFGRLDTFPVDTWIEKVLIKGYQLEGWKRPALERFGHAHYGAAAGLAQQYLFAAGRRDKKSTYRP